jgi:trigger factor
MSDTLASPESIPNRDIPEPIKREVRLRCGFGCVLCGRPLYQYEHMEGWAKVHRHVASEITLLCDDHERERTNGLLPIEMVRAADKDPYNKRTGVSKPYDLHYEGDVSLLVIGGNKFGMTHVHDGSQLVGVAIDDEPLLGFTFEDGRLFLTARDYDDDNRLIFRIEKNELLYSVEPWDIRFEGRNLTIREGHGQFLIDLLFETPCQVVVRRGRFQKNGLAVLVSPDQLCYANTRATLRGADVVASTGVAINSPNCPRPAGISFPAINRGAVNREAVERWMAELRETKDSSAKGNGDGQEPSDGIEQEFRRLADVWRAETEMCSSVSKNIKHPAYQAIIKMGEPALRFILRELQDHPDLWFPALKAIAKTSPVPPEQSTDPKLAREAWLLWGRKHGWIK